MKNDPFRLDLNQLSPFNFTDLMSAIQSIRVLVVVDQISVEDSEGFGIGKAIQHLRSTRVGCTQFKVDVASRLGGSFVDRGEVSQGQVRFEGFRFDSKAGGVDVLSKYHVVMLFAYKPDNSNGPDSNINLPTSLPASDAELTVLFDWMNAGGGVFATGDHDYLGASMCHKIPRVGTMRKWTNADGVPPNLGVTRIDTNQPANAAQEAGAQIPSSVQRDHKPQKIEWVTDRIETSGYRVFRFPHEILCHPSHGPIDVMPDHPHEGVCNEVHDIDLEGKVQFNYTVSGADEYPERSGIKPQPKVIAYGETAWNYNHQKGAVNRKRFPMISVYDGHSVDHGRVVVDSTWHHWMNMNIDDIYADANQTNWEKISRYFVNVVRYLAPAGVYREHCWWQIASSHFEYPGLQEYVFDRNSIFSNGSALRHWLGRSMGPCGVFSFARWTICQIDPATCEFFQRRYWERDPKAPGPWNPEVCLTCPPWDYLETLVLGGMVDGTRELAQHIREAERGEIDKGLRSIETNDIYRAAMSGARKGVERFRKEVRASVNDIDNHFCG